MGLTNGRGSALAEAYRLPIDVKSYQKGHLITTRETSICMFQGAKCSCVMNCVTHLREIIELRLHVLFKSIGVTTLVKQVERILYLHTLPPYMSRTTHVYSNLPSVDFGFTSPSQFEARHRCHSTAGSGAEPLPVGRDDSVTGAG